MNNSRDTNNTDNTQRSLKRLAIVDAWFRRSADRGDRYTLHADVSFNEERLGGESEAEVIFRVAVRQCDIVFIRPKGDFSVDRESVRRQPPLSPQEVTRRKTAKTGSSLKGKLSLKRSPSARFDAEIEHERGAEKTTESTHTTSAYNEQFTRSTDGHDAWRVDGSELENGRLRGPVFNAQSEPRLTLIDLRNEERRMRDERDFMTPISRIEVRCLREDIEIYDIKFKDEAKHNRYLLQPGKKEKMAVARQVLRQALLQECLSVGNLLDDPFAEMTICDATIPIVDQSDQGS